MVKYTVTYRTENNVIPTVWVGYLGSDTRKTRRLFQLHDTPTSLIRVDEMWVNGEAIPASAMLYPHIRHRAEFLVRDEVTTDDFVIIRLL